MRGARDAINRPNHAPANLTNQARPLERSPSAIGAPARHGNNGTTIAGVFGQLGMGRVGCVAIDRLSTLVTIGKAEPATVNNSVDGLLADLQGPGDFGLGNPFIRQSEDQKGGIAGDGSAGNEVFHGGNSRFEGAAPGPVSDRRH